MLRENLRDGGVRLSAGRCSFTLRRLRPGAVLVEVAGADNDELGQAPLDELDAEIGLHGPMELFVDTTGATSVATRVSERWTRWFQAHQRSLRRVSILVASKFVELTVSVAKLFSRTGELIKIYVDRGLFDEAIERAAPGYRPRHEGAPTAPLEVKRESLADGALKLSTEACSFVIKQPRPGALLLTVEGDDTGELGRATLEMVQRSMPAQGQVELFADLRRAVTPGTAVSSEWLEWIDRNRPRLSRVTLLTGSRVQHLALTIALQLSSTVDLVKLEEDPAAFDQALRSPGKAGAWWSSR